MFRFVYAFAPGDHWDSAFAAAGFVGVESDGETPDGVARVGVRNIGKGPDVPSDRGIYNVVEADGRSPSVAGRQLRELAAATGRPWWAENGGAFATAAELWALLDAAGDPLVKAAIDIESARVAGQTAAVLVPTLNLRIGLVRARTPGDDLTAYARRLAGIGFDGFVVLDPPPGPGRADAALAMAAAFRGVFQVKPAKKTVPAKAG